MDIRQAITDRIVAMLERGGNTAAPLWRGAAKNGLPHNAHTGVAYRGVNVLILWDAALSAHYASNSWLTYKQAADLGGQVRKGEKGVMCVFFKQVERRAAQADEVDAAAGFFPMCKSFWLFNVAQIDGLPELSGDGADCGVSEVFSPIASAESVIGASGAIVSHGFDAAFYARGWDIVCMPERGRFINAEAYYSTLLHELTHWTGHPERLNRQFGKRFGDDAYAFEELVAELGAAFTVGRLGFSEMTLEHHASYLESWLKVLRNDKTAIFSACKHASAAYDLLAELEAAHA